jgi:Ca2+-binding RTX toxin-like protein
MDRKTGGLRYYSGISPDDRRADSYKDLYNNAIGRAIGKYAKENDLSQSDIMNLVEDALDNGDLIVDPDTDSDIPVMQDHPVHLPGDETDPSFNGYPADFVEPENIWTPPSGNVPADSSHSQLRLDYEHGIYGVNSDNGGTLVGEETSDILRGGAGADELQGEEGRDYLAGQGGDDTLVGGLDSDVLVGGGGNDELFGGHEGLTSLDGNDLLLGGEGADELYAGGGVDILSGGAGDDTFVIPPQGELESSGAAVILWGGAGSDLFRISGSQSIMCVTIEDCTDEYLSQIDLDAFGAGGVFLINPEAEDRIEWNGALLAGAAFGVLDSYTITSEIGRELWLGHVTTDGPYQLVPDTGPPANRRSLVPYRVGGELDNLHVFRL